MQKIKLSLRCTAPQTTHQAQAIHAPNTIDISRAADALDNIFVVLVVFVFIYSVLGVTRVLGLGGHNE